MFMSCCHKRLSFRFKKQKNKKKKQNVCVLMKYVDEHIVSSAITFQMENNFYKIFED